VKAVKDSTILNFLRPFSSSIRLWQLKDWRLNMPQKNNKYTYRFTWYVGLCAEFPSLSWLARTPEAALKGIRKLVHKVIADMIQNAEPIPDPKATRQFSASSCSAFLQKCIDNWAYKQLKPG